MNSLEIGEYIVSALTADEKIAKIVGDHVFPLVAENETPSPFILYRRTSQNVDRTKDGHFGDSVVVEIQCLSDKYSVSLDLLKSVQRVLESRVTYHRHGICRVQMINSGEEFDDSGSFIQTGIFNIEL